MVGTMTSKISVHWFRHGLRLHDNPALIEAVADGYHVIPIFINDGESAGLKVTGYNRVKYLCDALEDLDCQFRRAGSQLYVCEGSACEVLRGLHAATGFDRLTFEQDCEAIWNKRDAAVRSLCEELGISIIEKISHTLWNPFDIVEANGGIPPLTYEMFLQVSTVLGSPPRPIEKPEMMDFPLHDLHDEVVKKLKILPQPPTPEDLGYSATVECPVYVGGETIALLHLKERLKVEKAAFKEGYILPNQVNPDVLGPPMSMSAALRFGCLSVRKFYWSVQDLYNKLYKGVPAPTFSLTAQLIWREFFYCMSSNNSKYDCMEGNPICIQIPWYRNDAQLEAWSEGKTGYPFIDASMRQLKKEGWIHHVCRTAVSCFLTRGDLWLSWEDGLQVFLKYLIDADWSVCAGNWMWVSSSAFERQLDCSSCISPVVYGKRIDPTGEYIRRHVPELAQIPQEYIFEPWLAPEEVQKSAKCIIGKDYPTRIVKHSEAVKHNNKLMHEVRQKFAKTTPHCCPSNNSETYRFLNLSAPCAHGLELC